MLLRRVRDVNGELVGMFNQAGAVFTLRLYSPAGIFRVDTGPDRGPLEKDAPGRCGRGIVLGSCRLGAGYDVFF